MIVQNNALGNNKGMTLVEIIVVIVLIGLVFGFVATKITGQSKEAKARLNVTKMEMLKGTVERYRSEHNVYPPSLDCLKQKCQHVTGVFFPMVTEDKELKDIWDRPFVYKTEGDGRSFSLSSYGDDGIPGGDGANQDITVKP